MKPTYFAFYTTASVEDLSSIPWESHTEARQECFMSLSSDTYTYGSGRGIRTYLPIPFLPWVDKLRMRLNRKPFSTEEIYNYNVCFLNKYEDNTQHLGWHADDTPGMDHDHPIAVVSFGQSREIWWRHKGQTGIIPDDQRQLLMSGSLFIMPPGFQREHEHRIPKGDRKMEPRISLTFRHYIPNC
jgi:alkylated DNA repair dioxygenase AlkB